MPIFPRPHRARAALLVLGCVGLLFAGCKRYASPDTSSPDDPSIAGRLLASRPWEGTALEDFRRGGRLVYPLAVGNRWEFDVHTRFTVITDQGPQPPTTDNHTLLVEITGTQQLLGRDYVLQRESDPARGGALSESIVPVRQDRTGLYEFNNFPSRADAATTPRGDDHASGTALSAYLDRALAGSTHPEAFRSAAAKLVTRLAAVRHASLSSAPLAGAAAVPELQLLRYPLRVWSHWIVLDSPRFTRAVTGRERINVPAGSFIAWRLRATSEFFGPNERVRLWYAGPGLVRMALHLEGYATDEAGNLIGTVFMDEDQVLHSFQLVGGSNCIPVAGATLEPVSSE